MGRWQGKYVIGITGNIATGKSLVRKMLQQGLGAYTIDADGLAHRAMLPNAPAYRPVVASFGTWILGQDKRIDRSRLAAVAFSHPAALARLEAVTHPIIRQAIDTLIRGAKQKIVVVEAIKLLESPLAEGMDAIWVVDADPEKQIERLMRDRKLTEQQARLRMETQGSQADKITKATVVINNNGDPNQTWNQVKAAWAKSMGKEPVEDQGKRVQVQPKPQAAPSAPASQAGQPAAAPVQLRELIIKRANPGHLDEVAKLINNAENTSLNRTDLMLTFTKTSYLVAEGDSKIVGVVSFAVENLITEADRIVIAPTVETESVLVPLIQQMEEAADLLQSEVSFIYLKQSEHAEIIQLLQKHLDYKILERVEDIRFPAWREALRARPEGTIVLMKQLREERRLTPFS